MLANLVVRTGTLKGQRLPIRTPIANLGRADYNDVCVPEESVSTAHAKLQRREGVWILVDLDSTNGTFVDGERVRGEAPLVAGALLRLGDVQMVFDPTGADDAMGMAKGGGTKVMQAMKPGAPAPPAVKATPKRSPPSSTAAPATPPKKGKGCGAGAAAVVLALGAAVYWFLV